MGWRMGREVQGSENGVAGVERGRSPIWGGRGVLVMKGGLIGGEVRGRAAMRERMYFYMCKFLIFLSFHCVNL